MHSRKQFTLAFFWILQKRVCVLLVSCYFYSKKSYKLLLVLTCIYLLIFSTLCYAVVSGYQKLFIYFIIDEYWCYFLFFIFNELSCQEYYSFIFWCTYEQTSLMQYTQKCNFWTKQYVCSVFLSNVKQLFKLYIYNLHTLNSNWGFHISYKNLVAQDNCFTC